MKVRRSIWLVIRCSQKAGGSGRGEGFYGDIRIPGRNAQKFVARTKVGGASPQSMEKGQRGFACPLKPARRPPPRQALRLAACAFSCRKNGADRQRPGQVDLLLSHSTHTPLNTIHRGEMERRSKSPLIHRGSICEHERKKLCLVRGRKAEV